MNIFLKAASILAVSVLATVGASVVQTKGDSRPYRLQKAYEVLQEDHDEERAIRLLNEQVKATPGDAECWMLLCRIYRNREEGGRALSCVNEAIKVNKPKKSDIYMSTLYWWKASVYDDLGDNAKEIEWLRKALDQARRDNKSNVQEISFDLAQALYDEKDYEGSDAVYNQMLKEDEADQEAMVGLARNMIRRGNYLGAVELLDDCQRYDADYPDLYKFRSEAYDMLGETDKAIDDLLDWFDKDEEPYMFSAGVKRLLKHRSYAVAKATGKMRSSDRKADWRILLIGFYEESGDYANALWEYDALEEEYGKDEFIYSHRADCYDELGLTEMALREIDKALEIEDDYVNNAKKGGILRAAGRYEEAIRVFDHAIRIDPASAFAYYAKGWCHELSGNDTKALECYEKGIDIDKTYAYIYLMRGEQHLKAGDRVKAEEDFRTILQMDTVAVGGSCRHYALHFLGRDEEAEEWMRKIIEDEPYRSGRRYDMACLYARMGRYDEAVRELGKALEMGYAKFQHLEHDDDMDCIREREDFKAMVARYKAVLEERVEEMGVKDAPGREELITEVPFTRRSGGTFDVDCSVNGLNLSMIFDTGASDVTISKVEADFMLKNKYLSRDDVKGRKYYQIADGGISEGTVITLREVRIGDAVLHNVDASVVKNQKAPLLLGESVLQKFGTFTVDNINSKLIIRH